MLKRTIAISLLLISIVSTKVLATPVAEASMNGLPWSTIEELKNYDIRIVPAIEKVKGFEHKKLKTVGCISYDKKIILVEDNEKTQQIFYHEVGHLFDTKSINGDIDAYFIYSDTEEFENIHINEKANFMSYWHFSKGDINEYFADCFGYYFTEPVALQENCPLTYAYIDRLIVAERLVKPVL